ncbi:HlyC/CorC family transporter [Candidatus Poribacteria bacterium]|nr:HlyC/CorC family transporter [Candidatus Poribacteria bacterium]
MSERCPLPPPIILPSRLQRIGVYIWLFVGSGALVAWAQTAEPVTQGSAMVWAYSGLCAVCVVLSAVMSGSETAFLTANRARITALAEAGNRRARALLELYAVPERTQTTTLVGNNIVNVSATAFSLMLIETAAANMQPQFRDTLNTLAVTPLLLVFGEILPKSIARSRPDIFLNRVEPLLAMLDWALRPVSFVVLQFAYVLMKLTGQEGEAEIVTREDLRLLAEMSESEGVIHQEQRRMIHAVLDLDQQRVEQVMRPLADIVSVAEGTPFDAFLDLVAETGHSRIPVYCDRIDNITGTIHILDVVYAEASAETIDGFIRRELLFVPETKRVATLLAELRYRRNPMAFVVDEYGGIVGLVTVEDLVEEIVGEIRDERDRAGDAVQLNARTMSLECDGKMEIDALNDELDKAGIRIPPGDYETVGGFIVHALDKIPRTNDVAETDDLLFIVVAADARSVQRVRIVRKRARDSRRPLSTES